MKNSIVIAMILLITASTGFAQLTGTKSIPGDYTIASAIAALNAQGVGTGGVTFLVAANYKEPFASPAAGYLTNINSSSVNPVVFKRTGTGTNPLITSATGTGSMDAIISIAGCDYVTFESIDLRDNPANYDSDTQMEWGFAVLKTSGTNGSQNITIKNCTITFAEYNTNSTGVYVNNHTSTSISALIVSAPAGTNSNLKIFGNTIENSYNGIYLTGFAAPAPYTLYDQNNEVGKDGANNITHVGGGDVAAYGIFTTFQNNLKVANNHITSITYSGTQPHYGIFLTTALNANYDLYENYVSIQFYGTGSTASFYPIQCDMGGSGTSNIINIYNNTVTGCQFPTAENSNQYTYYMFLTNLGFLSNVYGNVISNNTVGDAGITALGRIWYLVCRVGATTPGTLNLHDNSITGNERILPPFTPALASTNFLQANTISGVSGNLLNMYNNVISNNVVASNNGTYLIYSTDTYATKNIYDNTVSNISKAEGPVYCLYYGNFNEGVGNIFRNKIFNIEGVTTNINITGIYITGGSGTNIYNNMISDLRVPGASLSSGFINNLSGIAINAGSSIGVYNNSVYLASPLSGGGGSCGSSALLMDLSAGVDSRNNIFVNNSVPSGTGRTVALRMVGSGTSIPASFSLLSNYNDLYAGTPDPTHLIFSMYNTGTYVYSDDISLSSYKTRVYPREVQSVTELPPFINIATSPFDLHLQNSVATQCESGGVTVASPLAITTDFDNQPRYPNAGYPVNVAFNPNAPDIGADEVGGLYNDLTAPAISYVPLLNSIAASARTLNVTITDGSGAPTAGIGLPMLYWKKNSEAYVGVQGINLTPSTYKFTFGAGTSLGDVVSYYVVAQDNAIVPNVGVYPLQGASGFYANPPVVATPPNSPSTYTIVDGVSGVFHVGTGKDFNTLTAAATHINERMLTGPVTLILDDAAYPAETFPVTFNANAGSSVVNTLTLKPNSGVSPLLTSGADNKGILDINGIDYFILDGSNNGTNSKNLKIKQSNTTTGFSYGVMVKNYYGNDPSTNVTIKNCTIQCTPVHSSVMLRNPVIFSYDGGGYDNFIIENNTLIGGFDGILVDGATTAITHNGQITNNIIGSMTDSLSTITHSGISLQYADHTLISGNEIIGPYTGSLNMGMAGIFIGPGSTNTIIRKNSVHEIYNNNPNDGWGARGIQYHSDASTITEITDNLIYDIKGAGKGPGLSEVNPYGIFIRSGGNMKILHNTIFLDGPYLSSFYDGSSACIAIGKRVTGGMEIRNNILRNSMVCNGQPNINGKAYGVILEGAAGVFSLLNNNDYFIDGYMGSVAQQYNQSVGIIDFATLADWQAFTGQDANSVVLDPVFIPLPILMPSSVPLNNKGVYINTEPTDYTGMLRTNPPDIGAYEFGADPLLLTLPANSVTGYSAVLTGSVNPSGNTVSTWFDYGKTTSYGTTVGATPGSISGSSTTGFQVIVSGLNISTTYHYRARSVTSTGLITYGTDMTFTTTSEVPENISVANTISNTTCFNASQTITVAGTPNTFMVTPTGSVTMIAGQNIKFMPGTTVLPGGYLHGYISGEYCGFGSSPAPAGKVMATETPMITSQPFIKVYPNPTSGAFTLEINNDSQRGTAEVEIFSMRGDRVLHTEIPSAGKHDLSLAGRPVGIYIIRVISGNKTETARIIRQ